MSRTWKDRPNKIRFPNIRPYGASAAGYPKLPKHKNTEWHWLGATPSWWTRLMMNRPMRRRGRWWEATVTREVDLRDSDPPNVSRKPHEYYW